MSSNGSGNGHSGPPQGNTPPSRTGFNFSTFFIKNPTTTVILAMILVILGAASFLKMPLELFPNVEFPVVIVTTPYPGAAPAEVETLVTRPIEDALSGLNGLDTLTSSSMDGVSNVVVQMQLGVSSKDAASDIRDKVSAILYKLPTGTKPPSYTTFNTGSVPIVTYTITGQMSKAALSTYVKDEIEPKLEQVEGIAQLQLLGDEERDVAVDLDPLRLQAYGLGLTSVFQDIQAGNYNLPGGKVDAQPRNFAVRVMGKYDSPASLATMPIETPAGGTVQLGDLGTVQDGFKDPITAAYLDGQDAVFMAVVKQTDANAVDVVSHLDQAIANLSPTLPEGIRIIKGEDSTQFIKQSNQSVWESLGIGAALAVLVLYMFLRSVGAMAISGLAIPLSILMAFTPMYVVGFTSNNLTMMALSLVVGILVDDAVVDLENIFRHMENGEPPIQAAINATGEIQLAVTATTLTIVGVFLPMSFMGGFIGKFFKSFGLTVTFAVLFSLLIARTLTPMLAAYFLKVKPRPGHEETHLQGDLSGRYPRLLDWCLSHRAVIMLAAVLTFVGGMSVARLIQTGFMSNADRGQFTLKIQMPRGTALQTTAGVANQVAQQVLARYPGVVTHVYTMIGESGDTDSARLDVELVDKSKRHLSDTQLAKQVRDAYAGYAGARVMADQLDFVSGESQKPIQVELLGDDLTQMEGYADRLSSLMTAQPGTFADVESSLGEERPELRIVPDRARLAQEGISVAQLASTLQLATTGDTPNTLSEGPDEVDVWVRLAPAFRKSVDTLSSLTIQTPHGPVPLSAVSRVVPGGGFPEIDRKNRQRMITVSANLIPGVSVGTATSLLQSHLVPALDLPRAISVNMDGDIKQQRDAFSGFGQAMLMGVTLIYFILALQFGSFLHPLTIMFSLPLSIVGAFLGLLIGHQELGMMALIGIIMLMGIVTKNAILIVDFILTMRHRGFERNEAVLRGAQVRLRPILMTTAAMVLGMAPMALGIGAGAEFREPMAVVVIGGLLTSTALTLVVVPVAYTIMEDWKHLGYLLVMRRDPRAAAVHFLDHLWPLPRKPGSASDGTPRPRLPVS